MGGEQTVLASVTKTNKQKLNFAETNLKDFLRNRPVSEFTKYFS